METFPRLLNVVLQISLVVGFPDCRMQILVPLKAQYSLSRLGPITKADSRVYGSGKVHSWKTCKNSSEYKHKRDIKGPWLQADTSL